MWIIIKIYVKGIWCKVFFIYIFGIWKEGEIFLENKMVEYWKKFGLF